MTFGATKYSAWNWAKGMKWSRLIGALLRHLLDWARGQKLDPESGLPHLWHALCCLVFLVVYEKRNLGEDDRWIPPADVIDVEPEASETTEAVAILSSALAVECGCGHLGAQHGPAGCTAEVKLHNWSDKFVTTAICPCNEGVVG